MTALLIAALVPVIIMTYEVIFTKDRSVLFLGNYPQKLVFIVICYYIFLMGLGLFWLVKQLIFAARLKNEKLKAELMLLKSQVNPHFFFNMLNNLYGWTRKDPERAQEMILKLSDMMRYSIYEGEKETVAVADEISFLKNFIELHKMRYHKPIDIVFINDIEGNQKIIPLLLITLLENAFKHGVEKLRENAFIKMSLTHYKNQINFQIENNYEKTQNRPGIGLKNLKRRLELTYPNRHKLTFSITKNIYKAELILIEL
ncbi:hypothetical protein CFS9_39410 [Flavobacterium sp. CFS9]|uniref:Signal transduction histidine kinase internal region domain-containing protein n=1 Tax=Flavobacterium sp. CFS9 TaxID=3143118 RepID=A0AAT9H6G9_9FLAO